MTENRSTDTGTAPARDGIHPALSLAMVVTPVVWLAAEAVSPALKSDSMAQLTVIADHPTAWYWYTILLLVGSLTGIPAAIGLMRLGAAGMRRLGTVGGVLVTLGFVGSTVDAAGQLWAWQMVDGGADRHQMAALLDRVDNGTNLLFAISGIGLMVGTVMLTVALSRNRSVPTWAAVVFGVSVFANVVAFGASSVPAVAASCVLLLAGMGTIGVTTLRGGFSFGADVEAPRPSRTWAA